MTHQHSVDMQTAINWREVHQVVSSRDLQGHTRRTVRPEKHQHSHILTHQFMVYRRRRSWKGRRSSSWRWRRRRRRRTRRRKKKLKRRRRNRRRKKLKKKKTKKKEGERRKKKGEGEIDEEEGRK